MRSLFWKVFLWFWGAMVAMGLALYGVVLTTQPPLLPPAWRHTANAALARCAAGALREWQQGGRPALRAYLEKIDERSHSHLWFYAGDGRELSGRPIPPVRPDPNLLPPPGMDLDAPPGAVPTGRRPAVETVAALQQMRRRALSSQDTVFVPARPRVLIGRTIAVSPREKYVLAGSLLQPRVEPLSPTPRARWIGALVLLGLSGLVCYGLVSYLTGPIVALQTATRRLAAGDLSARTHAGSRARRDEVANLGRDFDAMAGRIETLLLAQNQLLGDISHELRSPLSRLGMALALARRHAGDDNADLRFALDRIGREKERLNHLIGQLLELTRLESGEAGEPRETVDVEALVREVVADADFEAHATGRSVRLVNAQPCAVEGSAELLQRAVENVVRNAARYTPPGTTVQVSLEPDAAEAVILVRDYGPGVPEAALEKLFQPFYRVAEARDRQSGGAGLGLAITRRAVMSHGGHAVATNAPGGGLQIELRLPLAESTPAS
jgi:two-component system sensor histidine kinase CpxA